MKQLKYILILLLATSFTSCLKSGLDDLPAYEEAEIEDFYFEYRWLVKNGDYDQMRVQTMNVTATIDTDAATVDCVITVPAESNGFTTEVRDQVNLSNLVGFADISIAATMTPINGAPILGKVADFSGATFKYEVTAADGTKKVWTLTISDFIK